MTTFMLWEDHVFLSSSVFLQMFDGMNAVRLDQIKASDYACLCNF